MKRMSFWAKDHKQAARILIILSFLLLTLIGNTTGTLLNDLGITIPAICFIVTIIIYFIALLCYPSHSRKRTISTSIFYRWQKTCDLFLAATAFFMMTYASNDNFKIFQNFNPLNASTTSPNSLPADSNQIAYKSIATFSASLKNEKGGKLSRKERKKLLKEQIKAIKKSDELSKGGKITLIILSVIVAMGLLFLVASLSCSLSCSGSGTAALLVGFGGAALVIFLLIVAIKAINKKHRKKPLNEGETPKPD